MLRVTELECGGAGILTQAGNQSLPSMQHHNLCVDWCGIALYSFIQGLFIEYIVLDNGDTRLIGQRFCPQKHSQYGREEIRK